MGDLNVKLAQKWLFEGARLPIPITITGPVDDLGGGSYNMKGLRCLYALLGGLPDGEQRMLAYYKLERESGHTNGEILTDSHAQLYYSIHGQALRYALQHASTNQLVNQIAANALRWLRNQYYILSLCEIPGAPITESPWTPGARDAKDGEVVMQPNEIHGKFLAAVRGQKFRGKDNQYDHGVWVIKSLPEPIRAQIRERPDTPPAVLGDLSICRWDDGRYWAVFGSLPVSEGGVRAAGWNGTTRWAEREHYTEQLAAYPDVKTADIVVNFPLPATRPDPINRSKPKPKKGERP